MAGHQRFSFLLAAFVALGLEVSTGASLAANPESGTLTGLMFYATDSQGADARGQIEDPSGEAGRYAAALRKVFKTKNFILLGKHTSPISQKYSIWLKPSPQFPLQIENTGQTEDGGLALYWILWQKEQLPTKDRELVKSNTVLKRETPLFIGGPNWRQGRLVFVVRSD
jgi:hypothetical protein